MSKLKILLCDDHQLIRDGIKALLCTQDNFEVIGEADNGKDAIRLALSLNPDIILMDIQMPECNGLEAVSQIINQQPHIKILILTVSEDREDLFEAVKRGAKGYLLKNLNMEELFQSILSVHRGETPFSPGLSEQVLSEFSKMAQKSTNNIAYRKEELTKREREILQYIAYGYTNQDVANKLYISPYTVKKHIKNINEKLQVHNRTHAVAYAIQRGWIQKISN